MAGTNPGLLLLLLALGSLPSPGRGAAGRSNSYRLELRGGLGGPVRTRRMGNQENPNRLSGVNVCGGQCCHGWSAAQGSQRCTKPNCFPQCQNGGMCLRPQLCVCKPGSKGTACEQKTMPTLPLPAVPGHTNEHHANGHATANGHANGHNVIPQRPIPQQASPHGYTSILSPVGGRTQMKLTVKPSPQFLQPHYIQQHIQQQIRSIPVHSSQSQQIVVKPKYYQTGSTHTLTHTHSDRPFPLSTAHNPFHGKNHTGRIKVVFTPTICKLTCIGGRCHNNCELGNTTTIISENGHATDTLTAPSFRVVVCHLPCMNGGRCSARDKCQCPPSFTGKFCQIPVQDGQQQQPQQPSGGQTQVHSTHTLPLTYSHGQTEVLSPNIVNIHIKHPPEASVQVHQVSQIDTYHNNGQQLKGSSSSSSSSSSSYSYHHSQSSHKIQHHGYNLIHPNQHGYQFPQQPVTTKNALGRCFQETAGSQCGKALPGLTKQDQCCGTMGTSWGFHKCHKCPNKSSIPLIDCPQGYKRVNASHCQDLDECELRSLCPNGNCVNTVGSYRCSCKPGFVPDSTFTTCISTFKEICPGGMGYTVLPNPPVKGPVYQEPTELQPPQPLPTPERPVEAFGTPEENIVVIERTSPPAPVEILPTNAGQDIAPTQSAEVDECHINPSICGPGICYNTAESYTCHCDEGFHLDQDSNTCTDLDECQDDGVCVRGHCENTFGSFRCNCGPGFRVSAAGDQCEDVDECLEETRPCEAVGECVNNLGSYSCSCPAGYRQVNTTSCRDVDECVEEAELCSPHGRCVNTEGSYSCVCDAGFTASLNTPTCEDVDECLLNASLCGQHGYCDNRPGTFRCLCDQGYQEDGLGQGCEDVNECELLSSVCGEAQCVNVDGSFLCVCPSGQEYNVMVAKCEAIPTAPATERKECYYRLSDENLCESVLTTHVTLQECCCTLGAGWGDNCEVHPCPVNETSQFNEMCPSGRGFIPSGDLQFGVPLSNTYKDADECTMFDQEVCKGGFCLDTEGSYECYCKTGQDYDPVRLECRDINECLDDSVCVGGQCLNTDGSFMCFCTHPMVLDPSSNHCIFVPDISDLHDPVQSDYQGLCWQTVTESLTCSQPLTGSRKTTYTECCCLYGEAWGMECALCPPRDTEDYASMCNLPLGGVQQPYGHDALVAGPVHQYDLSLDYSPSPIPPFYENQERDLKAFEGLQAEECGVLNGCENGRCVRVQEGYTCDCLDGYILDLSRMACIDVNECSELNGRMSLCRNAECVNTPGSYRCVCLPGFRPSSRHNYCVEAHTHSAHTHTHRHSAHTRTDTHRPVSSPS